jgi:hypothetical protein
MQKKKYYFCIGISLGKFRGRKDQKKSGKSY